MTAGSLSVDFPVSSSAATTVFVAISGARENDRNLR